jgi:hypothetical protein
MYFCDYFQQLPLKTIVYILLSFAYVSYILLLCSSIAYAHVYRDGYFATICSLDIFLFQYDDFYSLVIHVGCTLHLYAVQYCENIQSCCWS